MSTTTSTTTRTSFSPSILLTIHAVHNISVASHIRNLDNIRNLYIRNLGNRNGHRGGKKLLFSIVIVLSFINGEWDILSSGILRAEKGCELRLDGCKFLAEVSNLGLETGGLLISVGLARVSGGSFERRGGDKGIKGVWVSLLRDKGRAWLGKDGVFSVVGRDPPVGEPARAPLALLLLC